MTVQFGEGVRIRCIDTIDFGDGGSERSLINRLVPLRHPLSSDQRHKLQKRDLGPRSQCDFFIKISSLVIVDQNEEAVAAEGLDGNLELLVPVDGAGSLEADAIEPPLGVHRLHQAPKDTVL